MLVKEPERRNELRGTMTSRYNVEGRQNVSMWISGRPCTAGGVSGVSR